MKKVAVFIIILTMVTGLNAQTPRHEFGVHLGGGLSTLQYKPAIGDHKNGFGGMAGLGYTYFLSPQWGLTTGIDFSLYNATLSFPNGISNSYAAVAQTPAPDNNMTFSYTLQNYEEKQQAVYLNIPLMLQFQTQGNTEFYAALGAKIGFPLSGKAKTNDYTLSTQGYFPAEGRTYDDLPQYGFGLYQQASQKADLDLGVNVMAAAEAGVKWKVGDKNALYTGIYFDYGFTNVLKSSDAQAQSVAYSPTGDYSAASPMVASQYNGKDFTDKMNPMAIGVKVKYVFGRGEIKDKAPKAAAPVEDNSAALAAAEKAKQDEAARRKAEADRQAKEKETQERQQAQQEAQRKAEADRLAKEKEEQKQQVQVAKASVEQPVESYQISQTQLTPAQKSELDEKVALLQQHPGMKVSIYGHTCDLGGDAANEIIGRQRAQEAKSYLLSKGISEERIIEMASKRDTEPVVPNTSEANRRQNRRVELKVESWD